MSKSAPMVKKVLALAGLVLVSSVASSACVSTGDPLGSSHQALEATSTSPKADGQFVTLAMVSPQGVFICQKPDGGYFTSDGDNPIVQLYIDGQLVDEKYYNENKQDPDKFIVFGAFATDPSLNLSIGSHTAYCTALPDWPDLDPDADPTDPWVSCSSGLLPSVAPACTHSGVLAFDLAASGNVSQTQVNLSQTLSGNCGNGNGQGSQSRECTGWLDVPPGTFEFFFSCFDGSTWDIELQTLRSKNQKQSNSQVPVLTTLSAFDPSSNAYPAPLSKGKKDRLPEFSPVGDGACHVRVSAVDHARIKLTITRLELGTLECQLECLHNTALATDHGCDCEQYCHTACDPFDIDCGLPCNVDVPDYACPFLETTIMGDSECQLWSSDTGSFEHVGTCYRCQDGQQCCYTDDTDNGIADGTDNGSGSYDICPPISIIEPGPYGCFGPLNHCDCDVVPLCGCMAQTPGGDAACDACVAASCPMLGGDTFCERAADAAVDGFDWCAIVGDPASCFDRPPDF